MKRTLAALLSLCCVLTFALTACGGETTTAKPFDLDTLPQWQVLRSGAIVSDGTLDYQFIEYINRQV